MPTPRDRSNVQEMGDMNPKNGAINQNCPIYFIAYPIPAPILLQRKGNGTQGTTALS
ncbi:Uncharacterised protein [Bordetella pertussis]|nr:Uncharacterised protein [Bordetella pertussis]